jgi:hypothetical protein
MVINDFSDRHASINQIAESTFIEAGAGTGKTQTIAKRISNTDYKNRKTDYKVFQQKRIKAKQIPVYQYNLEGNFIKTWESAKIAAHELNIYHQQIGRCCRNEKYCQTAYGFIWKYHKD